MMIDEVCPGDDGELVSELPEGMFSHWQVGVKRKPISPLFWTEKPVL